MTNQESLPQLLFPTVNSDYCPTGTWAEIFNNFITLYLNNGQVNIPGLGDVTPQQIAAINATLVLQQNEIDALKKEMRNGNAALATGDQSVAVSFGVDMPTTDYYIIITPLDTGGAATTAFGWAVVDGSQTTTGFTTRWTDVPATIDSFNWQVIER